MSQPIIESLTRHDGYRMFYLVFGNDKHYQICREPLKFRFDRHDNVMLGPFNNFINNINLYPNKQISFAIWREIIDHTSYDEVDFDIIEKTLNSTTPNTYPSIIELFTYDMEDSYLCNDSSTTIMYGNRYRDNSFIVYMKNDKDTTGISHISFEIKLN